MTKKKSKKEFFNSAKQSQVEYLLQTHIDAEPWRIDRGAPSRSGVISNLIYMEF